MTNRLALVLALLIAAALGLDWLLFDGAGSEALGRRWLDLIDLLAVWR